MRKIKEVLRLCCESGLSQRAAARAAGVSCSTVSDLLTRARLAGLAWPLPEDLSDAELETRLYRDHKQKPADPLEPDWAAVHAELARHKHLTLRRVWTEYRELHPDGYGYSWFCGHYRRWRGGIDLVMRQSHKAAEKLFVDWAGDTQPYVDPQTGEIRSGHLFLAVLGYSNHTFARLYPDEKASSFLAAHVEALAFFGGVPELVVPDNLKTGVKRPDRYEAEIWAPYADLAAHYGAAILPARVRRPRDKAKVEVGVQIAEREILAPLRHRTFFSLAEANDTVAKLLGALNARPFSRLPGSRESVFREIEAPLLRPLPAEPYHLRSRKLATVHIDYHVELDGHCYSVPYRLVRERVELRFDARTIEVYHRGERVAVHARGLRRGGATTLMEHMPESHRAQAQWTPRRITSWAAEAGPNVAELCAAIMAKREHPALGFKSCLGVMRLGEKYGAGRLEAACRRALAGGGASYRSVKSVLERGLDREDTAAAEMRTPQIEHANLRGPGYYG